MTRKSGWATFAAVIAVVAGIAGIISTVYTVIDHHRGGEQAGAVRPGIPTGPVQSGAAPAPGPDPAAFRGTWKGKVTQFNTSSQYEVVIVIRGGDDGSIIGTSEYPSLKCRGELRLDRLEGAELRVVEYIVEGGGIFVGCVTEAHLVLTLRDDGKLFYRFFEDHQSFGGKVNGEGVLSRV